MHPKVTTYPKGKSSVSICHERGGTIVSLIINGIEILYNDPERRNNPQIKPRESFMMGPIVNSLSTEQLNSLGFQLERHGFLRDVPRQSVEDSSGKIILEYENTKDSDTYRQFPYRFKVRQAIELFDQNAILQFDIINLEQEKTMPFATGYHTYYKIDTAVKEHIKIFGVELSHAEIIAWMSGETTIRKPNLGKISLQIPGKPLYHITMNNDLKWLRFWTEKDKGFVCIEPVTNNEESFTSESLHIQPNEIKKLEYIISVG